MNKASKNFLFWGMNAVIYFVGMCQSIYAGYAGWIAILLSVPFVWSLCLTIVSAGDADLFVGFEEEDG